MTKRTVEDINSDLRKPDDLYRRMKTASEGYSQTETTYAIAVFLASILKKSPKLHEDSAGFFGWLERTALEEMENPIL
jgi:hypothetical protein